MKYHVLLSIALLLVISSVRGAASQQEEKMVRMYSLLAQLAILNADQDDQRAALIGQLRPHVRWEISLLNAANNQLVNSSAQNTFNQRLEETGKFLYYMLSIKGREVEKQDIMQFQQCSDDLAERLADNINNTQLLLDACPTCDEEFLKQSELSHLFE